MSAEEISLLTEFRTYLLGFQAISSLIKLNISELLQLEPRSAEQLSLETSSNPDRLFRYLRASSILGIFQYEEATEKWSNTSRSSLLSKPFIKNMWKVFSSYFVQEHFLHSDSILNSYKPPREDRQKGSFFEDLSKDSDFLALFQSTMKQFSEASGESVVKLMDLGNVERFLDVGGGDGGFALQLCQQFENLKVGVCDLPQVREAAELKIMKNAEGGRVEFIECDFLQDIPSGFDAIGMKLIVHDWDDEKTLRILNNCRRALRTGSRLFIIDFVISKDSDIYNYQVNTDLILLSLFGFKVRSQKEMEVLLSNSGFILSSVKSSTMMSFIEAIALET